MIPTKIHGMLDYLFGILVIASPWLFNFDGGSAETWMPVVLGLAMIGYSLLTNYELGLVPRISMPTHLRLDAGSGLLLAISPYLFNFHAHVYWPHLILGLIGVAASQLTEQVPTYGPHHRPIEAQMA